MRPTAFVKSATTSTPVANSRGEMERLLRRYGCASFSVQTDYETGLIRVGFMVPDSLEKGAPRIPVRLEVESRLVYDALYGRPTKRVWDDDAKQYRVVWAPALYDAKLMAQAERVAWRHLLLWVDAALSAAAAGVQKISEAFLAHTLVRSGDRTLRMVEHMDEATGGNWRALLPPATTESA